MKRFSWRKHSHLVQGFHEEIILWNIRPQHLSKEAHLQLLRSSKTEGIPAYMRMLKEAYDEGRDGMFVWEMDNRIAGWSWLRVHENEFFKEGAYGELHEIYLVPEWQGKGLGETLMMHAEGWFREQGVRTVRTDMLASNARALAFYRRHGFKPNYISLQKELPEI